MNKGQATRGGSMEDVIFAGSAYKNPWAWPKSPYLYKSCRRYTPKYREYREIEITRRLYRSGESQYLINKTPVRLLDIRKLFMDTGV